jgi:hypothetical protein
MNTPGERERRGVTPLAIFLGKRETARLLPRGALAGGQGLSLPVGKGIAGGVAECGDEVADG